VPLYRYLCGRCGRWREDLASIADRHQAQPCEACGGELLLDLSGGFSTPKKSMESVRARAAERRIAAAITGSGGLAPTARVIGGSFTGNNIAVQSDGGSIDFDGTRFSGNQADFDVADTHVTLRDVEAD
jgi:putative FmdB family regulatory protein